MNNNNDAGVGSLRDCVAKATNTGDKVSIPSIPIKLLTPITITHSITIAGVPGGSTSIDGVGATRLFIDTNPTGAVTFQDLKLENGALTLPAGSANVGGAAVEDTGGKGLVFARVNATNNTVAAGDASNGVGGGAIYEVGPGSITGSDLTIGGGQVTLGQAGSADGGGGIYSAGPVTVTRLTIENSKVTGSALGSADGGAGLYDNGGTVTLTSPLMTGNTVIGPGTNSFSVGGGAAFVNVGAVAITGGTFRANDVRIPGQDGQNGGGAVYSNFGAATIAGTTVQDNHVETATPTSTAPVYRETGGAGIYSNGGTLNVTGSSVIQNTITITGNHDIGGAGIFVEGGTASITGTTVAQNSVALTLVTAPGPEPPYENGGGGVLADGATINTLNTTISDNMLTVPAGTLNGGGGLYANDTTKAHLTFTTVSDNHSTQPGGGIFNASSAVTLKNTIVAANAAGARGGNCDGGKIVAAPFTYSTAGNNLEDTAASQCGLKAASGDVIGQNPMLGPLQLNGSLELTRAVLGPSPAIDHIPSGAACTDQSSTPVAVDQRGVIRPQGAGCDIGAYEAIPADLALSATPSPSTVTVGGQSTLTFKVTNAGPADATNAVLKVTLPAGLSLVSGCAGSGAVATCPLGTVNSGSSASAAVLVTATAAGTQTATGTVGSDSHDPTPADNTATASVAVTAQQQQQPPPPAAPANTAAPGITGTPLPDQTLTCSTGTWSGAPTSYAYQWLLDGQPIAGATGASYVVLVGDSARMLSCRVTATGPGGAAQAASASVLVGSQSAIHCPKPTGRIGGKSVGPLALGMTRTKARHRLRKTGTAGFGFDDFCLYAGFGIRAAYPSAKLLGTLPSGRRHALSGRIVIALTANPYYSLHGVAPGASLDLAIRRLHLHKPFRIGLNDWYVAPAGAANVVVKARHHVVYELGLVNKSVTATRAAAGKLLTSFRRIS